MTTPPEANPSNEANPYYWYHAESEDAERWQGGYLTMEEAIENGRECYGDISFAICRANASLVAANFNEDRIAEIIIEDLIDNNEDCWGEDDDCMNGHGPVEDLSRRLFEAVKGWLAQYPWKGWNFDDMQSVRTILPRLTGDTSGLQGDTSKIWGDATGLTGDVTDLSGDVSNLRGGVSDLRGDVSGLTGDVSYLAGDVTNLRGDATGLNGDATGLSGDLDRIPLSARPCKIA